MNSLLFAQAAAPVHDSPAVGVIAVAAVIVVASTINGYLR